MSPMLSMRVLSHCMNRISHHISGEMLSRCYYKDAILLLRLRLAGLGGGGAHVVFPVASHNAFKSPALRLHCSVNLGSLQGRPTSPGATWTPRCLVWCVRSQFCWCWLSASPSRTTVSEPVVEQGQVYPYGGTILLWGRLYAAGINANMRICRLALCVSEIFYYQTL